jgi:hypothetical protein
MSIQVLKVLSRVALFSALSGIASAIIYSVIVLLLGNKPGGGMLWGSLITGTIAFVIAEVFYSGFMLYFARKRPS